MICCDTSDSEGSDFELSVFLEACEASDFFAVLAVFADLVFFSVVFCVAAADVVISWVTGTVVSSTQLSVITSEKSLMLPTASEAARLSSKASTSGARVVVGTTRATAARDTAMA